LLGRSQSRLLRPILLALVLGGCVQHTWAPGPGMSAYGESSLQRICRDPRLAEYGLGVLTYSAPNCAHGDIDITEHPEIAVDQPLDGLTPGSKAIDVPGVATQPSRASKSHQTHNTFDVALQKQGDLFVVPVLINGTISLDFVVDSGASDVSIPVDVVYTLMRAGTIRQEDFLYKRTYTLADGSTAPSQVLRIRSLKVGDKVLENVRASVVPVKGALLLGQSFLSRFKSWRIDNTRQVLVLE
jgi:clan AA aspartic protease (TIGR02281 family)